VDVEAHPTAEAPAGVLVLRVEGQLFFGNADYVRDRVRALVSEGTKAVVIDGQTAPSMSLLDPRLHTAWIDEVRRACADRPSIVARFRSMVATERELETVTAPVAAPALSPREREVLIELARGSTYADIAANLFVSENTVKTHISSLYSKLSAGRRSEALAVARTMHLI
jgi:DNA-binding NarL/FixJ family response regulator